MKKTWELEEYKAPNWPTKNGELPNNNDKPSKEPGNGRFTTTKGEAENIQNVYIYTYPLTTWD